MESIIGLISLILMLIIPVILIASLWIIFKKAGKGGWESIVPIYSNIVFLEIVGLPIWYIVLLFIPIANIYVMFKMYIELAHKFGKSTGFGVASVFFGFICLPILAFDKNCVYEQANVFDNQPMQPNRSIELPNNNQVPTNVNNNINNNNNPHIETPIVFNQNINTNLTPVSNGINNNIPNVGMMNQQPVGNNINQINQQTNNDDDEEGFQYNAVQAQPTTELVTNNNQQPNITPNMNPVPNINNINQPQINPMMQPQSVNSFSLNQMGNNQINNGMMQPNLNNQNMNSTIPQPVVNNNPQQPINVIPSMGPTPMPQQNNPNNPNM